MKIAEGYRAGVSMEAPITTRATFPRAAEALFQTKKTYVKQLHLRQHEDSRHAMKTDRITSADQIDCAVR